jgi:anion-transporting  ArsA/GET3 family ATPase
MLDMKQAWDRMIERYAPDRATARRILSNPLYQRITDSFVGSHEYAAIEAGAEVLAEVSDFVKQLQSLYGGIQGRAKSVYRLLRSPQTGFVVVTTLEQGPFAEAEFFCTKLREFKMPLRAVVVNRVLPDVFRDTGGIAAATTLVEDAKVAAWLTNTLGMRVTPDVARFVGTAFLSRSTLAGREARQLSKLGRLGDVPVVRMPLFSEEVSELEGLVRIAKVL